MSKLRCTLQLHDPMQSTEARASLHCQSAALSCVQLSTAGSHCSEPTASTAVGRYEIDTAALACGGPLSSSVVVIVCAAGPVHVRLRWAELPPQHDRVYAVYALVVVSDRLCRLEPSPLVPLDRLLVAGLRLVSDDVCKLPGRTQCAAQVERGDRHSDESRTAAFFLDTTPDRDYRAFGVSSGNRQGRQGPVATPTNVGLGLN